MPQRYNRNRMYGRGYRQYDPSYQAAGFNPAVFEGTSMEFKPYDYSIYERGLANLQARMDKAAEQQSAVDMALANIELQLNPAEREWFAGYKQDIKNQIQGDIDAGNFGSAIRKATKLAGQVHSDSKILNRIEYNKQYQAEKDRVLNDKTLSQTRKDRWVEENPYNYKDTFDENGNVTGGTQWTANWKPYSSLDMVAIYDTVKKLAAEEAGGGESAQFLDENGNLTSDVTKGIYGMAVKKGSKWERLPAEKLKRVFNNLFNQIPDAKEALLQQMDDRIWEYNKLDDEAKKSFIGSDIIKDDGTFRSPQEYLEHMVNPILSDMAYNKVYSSVDYGQAFANRAKDLADKAKAKQTALFRAGLINADDLNNTTTALTLNIDNQDRAGRTYASIQNALKDLNSLTPILNTPKAKEFLNNRDFDGLSDYLEKNLKLTGTEKTEALNSINVLRNDGKRYKRLIEPLDDDAKEAAEFVFAKQSGSILPNAKTNKYSREYANAYNRLFSYAKNPIKSNGRTPIDEIGIQFQDAKQYQKVLGMLHLNDDNMAQHGLSIKNIDGRTTLIVNKHSDKITDIADAFNKVGDRFWSLSRSHIIKFDNNGNQVKDYSPVGANTEGIVTNAASNMAQLYELSSNNETLNKAYRLTDNSFKSNYNTIQQTIQAQPFDDFNTQMLYNAYINGAIDRTEFNENKKIFEDNNKKAFGLAAKYLETFEVWGATDDSGNHNKLTPKEVEDAKKEILDAVDDGKYTLTPTVAPTGKGYGTIVQILGKKGKDGRENTVYYIDGLYDGPAAKAVANDPIMQARTEYQIDRGLGVVETDIVGNNINYNNPQLAISQYAAKADLNNFYKVLDEAKAKKETFTETEAKAYATQLLNSSGYSEEVNAEEFKEARAILVSRLLTYYGD